MARNAYPRERRAFGRRESCIHAVLHVAGRPPLHCIVRNYSEGGALLELPEEVVTSKPVRLVVESLGFEAVCEIRHTRGSMMGIRFYTAVEIDALVAASSPTPAAPRSEPLTGTELRKRLFGNEPLMVREYKPSSSDFLRGS